MEHETIRVYMKIIKDLEFDISKLESELKRKRESLQKMKEITYEKIKE